MERRPTELQAPGMKIRKTCKRLKLDREIHCANLVTIMAQHPVHQNISPGPPAPNPRTHLSGPRCMPLVHPEAESNPGCSCCKASAIAHKQFISFGQAG
jgi:hypothetical protein